MTCRRPTISVRAKVLERLARAASAQNEGDAPDSLEFEEVSWENIDRTSLVEGLDELLAHEAARVEEERREEERRWKECEAQRLAQTVQAQEWERRVMEQKRAEEFELRLLQERLRAREQAEPRKQQILRENEQRLTLVSMGNSLEREVVAARVLHERKKWKNVTRSLLAAAAVFGLVGGVSLSLVEESESAQVASLEESVEKERSAAAARVAELEGEIARAIGLHGENRALLEEQLGKAQAHLAALSKEQEEVDRRNPTEPPRKLAAKPVVKPREPVTPHADSGSGAVKVATDVVNESTCLAYDPMCFEL